MFTNLNALLPVEERYSYLFEGNNRQLDNILVTGGLIDTVFDFSALDDRIAIVDGQSLKGIQVTDANGDGLLDLVISASQGGKITLVGVSDPASIHIDIGLGLYGPVLSGGDSFAAHEMHMAQMPMF